eukprot:6361181-Amphidinium_carterae.2
MSTVQIREAWSRTLVLGCRSDPLTALFSGEESSDVLPEVCPQPLSQQSWDRQRCRRSSVGLGTLPPLS